MVDSSNLENRYSSKQRTIEGSNPSLSFFARGIYIYIYIIGFFRLSISILKGNCSAIPLAEPEQKKKGSIYNESKMKIKEYFFELWTCNRYRLGVPHQKGHCPCRLYCESYSD